MINITNKEACCGCSACAQICPKSCIKMIEDTDGCLYPQANIEYCIECGLCEKVCSIINNKPEDKFEQHAYIVQHKDMEVLRESTSGGAFTAIAQYVLNQGGVVCGAAYDEHLIVRHQFCDTVEGLSKYRNSKYVQSIIGDTYTQTRNFLKQGRLVMYSGTPCQLEGLLSFLRKPYENLITLDVVCHAVPAPLMFRKYQEWQKRKNDGIIQNILFRDKHYGYKYSTMSVYKKNGKNYFEGIDTDPYLRAFFQHISLRPSCYNCQFKKIHRPVDFTIWDCFDVDKFSKEMDNDKGVTRVLCHSERANTILNGLNDSLKIMEINPHAAIEGEKEIWQSVEPNPLRDMFFKDLNSMDVEDCFSKYFPITIRHRAEKRIRLLTNRLGIYKLAKKTFKLVNGNKEIKR